MERLNFDQLSNIVGMVPSTRDLSQLAIALPKLKEMIQEYPSVVFVARFKCQGFVSVPPEMIKSVYVDNLFDLLISLESFLGIECKEFDEEDLMAFIYHMLDIEIPRLINGDDSVKLNDPDILPNADAIILLTKLILINHRQFHWFFLMRILNLIVVKRILLQHFTHAYKELLHDTFMFVIGSKDETPFDFFNTSFITQFNLEGSLQLIREFNLLSPSEIIEIEHGAADPDYMLI